MNKFTIKSKVRNRFIGGFRVTEDVQKQLKETAKKHGITIGDLVNQMVEFCIKNMSDGEQE